MDVGAKINGSSQTTNGVSTILGWRRMSDITWPQNSRFSFININENKIGILVNVLL